MANIKIACIAGTPVDIVMGVDLLRSMDMKKICDWFSNNGVEAIILGYTHSHYIYEELKKVSSVPIIDPTEAMIELLEK